jgi:hypothetical protein
MICRHCSKTGKCRLFNRRTNSSNCDDEGYCLIENYDEYPEDSCDNYET